MNPHRGLPENITEAYYCGLMHSVGYRRKDLDKPQIVVVNLWTDVNPGHQPLRELAMRVKEGIWAAEMPGSRSPTTRRRECWRRTGKRSAAPTPAPSGYKGLSRNNYYVHASHL
jgi:dihydroxyacid dehydratase/phosphogluconate dehydratase